MRIVSLANGDCVIVSVALSLSAAYREQRRLSRLLAAFQFG